MSGTKYFQLPPRPTTPGYHSPQVVPVGLLDQINGKEAIVIEGLYEGKPYLPAPGWDGCVHVYVEPPGWHGGQ